MIKFQKFLIILLVTGYSLLVTTSAHAARLYFEPQEATIGATGEFSAAINIDADKRVNAFSLAISISEPLIPCDINEANSIINFFVDKPNWDEASRLLTFSGITPGGFQGEKGRLLVIKLKTSGQEDGGAAILDFDKEKTKVYLHTADGIEDLLTLEKLRLPVVKGKENIPVKIFDNEPPEWFAPEISQDQNMFGGKYFLVFAAQDKASGIAGYFVHESTRKKEIARISAKKWTEAKSPYVLKDQKLSSYVYVKAIDKAGNERIAIVAPKHPIKWYGVWWIWCIIILAIIAFFAAKKFKNEI